MRLSKKVASLLKTTTVHALTFEWIKHTKKITSWWNSLGELAEFWTIQVLYTDRTDLDSLYSAFLDFGNPFKEEEESLVQLSSKVMMEESSSNSVKQASQIGKENHQAVAAERLCSKDVSLYKNITKNKKKNSIVTSKSKHRIMSLIIFSSLSSLSI